MNAIEFIKSKGFNVVESHCMNDDDFKIIDNKDILIRLLKDDHISNDEFISLLSTHRNVDLEYLKASHELAIEKVQKMWSEFSIPKHL
jgi:hypothetical protein